MSGWEGVLEESGNKREHNIMLAHHLPIFRDTHKTKQGRAYESRRKERGGVDRWCIPHPLSGVCFFPIPSLNNSILLSLLFSSFFDERREPPLLAYRPTDPHALLFLVFVVSFCPLWVMAGEDREKTKTARKPSGRRG